MRIKLKTQAYLSSALLVLISIINSSLLINMQKVSHENHAWVIHTYQVIEETQKLLGHMRDAETGQRGYLLTKNTDYLEPYITGTKLARENFSTLVFLTQDNLNQQHELVEIELLIEDKFAELEQTISLHKQGKLPQALEVVLSNEGKLIMDKLRTKIDGFIQEEQRLLRVRQDKFETLERQITTAFIIESIIFVMAVFLLFWWGNKTIFKPLSTLTKSAGKFRMQTQFNPVEVTADNEMGSLIKAYNQMGIALSRSANRIINSQQQALDERDEAIVDATTDSLTGLKNRNYFNQEVQRHLDASLRYGHPFSLMLLDIDHFKQVNDRFGHLIGDEVLRIVGNSISGQIRTSDIAIRYGGEEILIILTHTDLDKAKIEAEQLRKQIEILTISDLEGGRITVSIGVAALTESNTELYEIVRQADKALYKAKNNGRNQVVA